MGVTCAMLGCTGSKVSKHRFPNPLKDPDRFYKWLSLCGNKMLFNLSSHRIYSNYRVCRKHFAEDSFRANNILHRLSYPTLFLPDPVKLKKKTVVDIVEVYIKSETEESIDAMSDSSEEHPEIVCEMVVDDFLLPVENNESLRDPLETTTEAVYEGNESLDNAT